ncbi:putative signal transducing protein [Indioceanicola profundi]|uniref:putative signal transducing protein n=1 Tax=Indioceanicola profundi TaxID=2220096 RepID=UPI000E6AC151|nr:DUF2007 domain-containing protein [Indioceanicola profundi]
MKALMRSNNLVELSFCRALLADAGIATVLLDEHTSVLEGSIGAIPRRLMVDEEDWEQARDILADADIRAAD